MEKTKAEKMYALIDQWRASGKTQKVFCGEHDIKVGTFAWWVARKKRDESLDSGFALVDMAGQPGSGKVEITYPNGVRISLDRKSTRLNSSHVAISYAVFCLKKKNESTRY